MRYVLAFLGLLVAGTASAQPINPPPRPLFVQQTPVTSIAANGALALIPANGVLRAIYIQNTTANAVTGGVDIGTTPGGADVASAVAVGANGLVVVQTTSLSKQWFSASASQQLYIAAHTAWNSASLTAYVTWDQNNGGTYGIYSLGGVLSGSLTINGTTIVTDPGGYQQTYTNAAGTATGTVLKMYGNSANQFLNGPGTVTIVGLGAGANLPDTDYLTTAVGYWALHSSTNANTESTAIGWRSQSLITTGGFNTTLGVNSMGTCVTCVHGIAIGTDSQRNTTTASYDIGIGVNTLINDTSAGRNLAIGDNAVGVNATAIGQYNIAIGDGVLNSAGATSSITANVLVGPFVAPLATTVNNSVVIGYAGLSTATTAAENVGAGYNVLHQLVTGVRDTCIGHQACYGVTTNDVTWLGHVSNANINSLTTATGSIMIGSNLTVNSATAVSQVNIGNTIYTSRTAPVINTGFGTGASIVNSAGSTAFTINVGTGGTALTGSVTLGGSGAPHGWSCHAADKTTPASFIEEVFSIDTVHLTINNYSRTTGAAIAWTASDVLEVNCAGY